jgi:hypothetical protein
MSGRNPKYRTFFQALAEELAAEGVTGIGAASGRNWFRLSGGPKAIYHFAVVFNGGKRLTTELYIGGSRKKKNEELFDALALVKEEIHADFGETLLWDRLEFKEACRISITRPGSIDDPDLTEISAWAKAQLLTFRRVFLLKIAAASSLKSAKSAPRQA